MFFDTDHIEMVSHQCVFWDVESKYLSLQIFCHTDHTEKVSLRCVFEDDQLNVFFV